MYNVLYQPTGTHALIYLTEKDGTKAAFDTEVAASVVAELLIYFKGHIQARVMDGDKVAFSTNPSPLCKVDSHGK